MSDQARWFKLWVTSLIDPHLSELTNEDYGIWAKLGCYVKAHGTNGSIQIVKPAAVLCSLLRVPDFVTLKLKINALPNVIFDDEKCNGVCTVTFKHWSKYQEDTTSSDRVKKHREKQKCNGDKKRREEKRINTPISPVFTLPEWLPEDVWTAFVGMRKSIKKPLTDRAIKNIVAELDRLRLAGHSPTAVLDQSITNCWQNVYEPKQAPSAKGESIPSWKTR